jgi:copper chaperone
MPRVEDPMTETTIDVDGMTCGSCARHIDGALKPLVGVSRVEVLLREHRVVIEHDPAVPTRALVEAIERAGYGARSAT